MPQVHCEPDPVLSQARGVSDAVGNGAMMPGVEQSEEAEQGVTEVTEKVPRLGVQLASKPLLRVYAVPSSEPLVLF
jgi:hypothetical protein